MNVLWRKYGYLYKLHQLCSWFSGMRGEKNVGRVFRIETTSSELKTVACKLFAVVFQDIKFCVGLHEFKNVVDVNLTRQM